jgi:hypothetical protein
MLAQLSANTAEFRVMSMFPMLQGYAYEIVIKWEYVIRTNWAY